MGGGQRGARVCESALPLHYGDRDRTRFAYAIYLLNKDVEQLLDVSAMGGWAHGCQL